MSLEKEIKQSEFRNEYQKAFINILFTRNYLINQANAIFKKYNITRQQFNVLRILRGQHPNPISINLIKERMLDKMSDTSRIVARLLIRGHIFKNTSSGDRRALEVSITKKGLALLQETDCEVEAFEELLQNLSSQEIQQFNLLLDKIRKT
jgi:DNA-binding MarR family transcriptional regulator